MDNQSNKERSIEVISLEPQPVFLPASAPRRLPRKPKRHRPLEFHHAFEDSILYYDAFHYLDERILLVGPPPHNLSDPLKNARYTALPSGRILSASFFASRSTMITELKGVPPGTDAVLVRLDGEDIRVAIGPSYLELFAKSRLLFTINKNNNLEWIRIWAQWHADRHRTDAVILFDNGSTAYSISEIEKTLASIPGLSKVCVVSVPHRFGPIDKWVLANHFWPRFLQISATTIALRRFGMKANGILNCDIDELVWGFGKSIYDLTSGSRLGALRIPGRWIEAAHDGPYPTNHLGFQYRLKGLRAKLSPPKCSFDPSREWFASLSVHPYLHRIHGAPIGGRSLTRAATFFHFKGINTNWKEERAVASPPNAAFHRVDELWAAAQAADQHPA